MVVLSILRLVPDSQRFSSNFSKHFPIVGSNVIGRYEFVSIGSLSALLNRTISPYFSASGKLPRARHLLNNVEKDIW
ncbi:hypothetical protein CEXT_795151 [Caerostris extrusa]|uniref:Maturase K n=1 Tax=Caerostris extrusa TaxID=172846 RepID=A0AAV4SEJ0_CAEEX|nr:hypothetical protein CEXT_795151 [Caerostris extrusa]